MRALESGDEFVDSACDFFVRGEAWENMVTGKEMNSLALANTACVGAPDVKAAVVFWRSSDVPAL